MKSRMYELMRVYYGLTMDEVAKACGVTKSNISQFEKGKYHSSVCENFYNHKNFRKLYEDKYGFFEPIIPYVEFVFESLPYEQQVDVVSSYPEFLNKEV